MAFERETNEIEVPEREGLEQKGLETGAKDLEDSDLGSVNLEELDFDEGDAEESEPADDEVQASELNHHNMDELSSDPDLDEADEDALDGTALAGDAEAGLPVEEETSAADEIADGGDPFEDVLPVEDETSTADEIAGGGAPVEDTLPTEGDEDDRVPEYFEPEGIMLVQNSRAPEAETVQPDESRQLQDVEPQTPQQIENVQPGESRQLTDAEPQTPQQIENVQPDETQQLQDVEPQTPQQLENIQPDETQQLQDAESQTPQQLEIVQPDESRQLQDAEPQTPQQLENVQPDESRQLQDVEPQTPQQLENIQPDETQQLTDAEPQTPQQLENIQPDETQQLRDAEPQTPQQLENIQPDEIQQLTDAEPQIPQQLENIQPDETQQLQDAEPQTPQQLENVQPDETRQLQDAEPQTPQQLENIQPDETRQLQDAEPQTPQQLENVQPDETQQLQDAEPQTPQQLENVQPDESRQLENDQTVESTTQQEVQPETTQAMEPTIEDRTSVQSMEMSGIIARDGENGKNEVQVDIRDEAAVRKAYRDEILYTNPDNRTFDKQLANLEERQNDLEGQIGRLEEKADQLKKEGKEDSKEYENTNKALDKAKSDLDENKTQQKLIRDTISDVKETEGLKRADQIAEQGKKDAPLKLDETYAKRSERYLENARDVVKDKIEALEKERKTLGSEGKERRAQIDAELNGAKKNLVKLEYSLARVKESIVAKEMKEIKAITDKIDRAKGKRAEKLKEKYITPEFRAKVERTVQRRKDAVALARSVEEANYIPPRVDSEDKSVETADKKQFAEDKVKAGHLATRMINAEKTVDQIRETAMSYTPHVENDDAKKRMAMYDAAMAGVKVIKDALYDPKQVADSLKEMKDATVDAYESINDENALVNEEQEKDNETLKDLEEGLREAEAGDPFKLSVAVSDITLDAIASSKDGGILNLETDRDRSYFEKFRECQKSAVELYQSAKDLAGSLVNPGKWPEVVKNLAQMSDKVFNVEDKAKAWIGTLLEDRYGKNYGADTDFASKFDRSLYEWVSRPDSKFERFVHYAATTSDALSGMGEQYKKFL